jgi:hypothetical protein
MKNKNFIDIIGPKLFSQVQHKSTRALFKVAILALQHNRVGFAKIFLREAVNAHFNGRRC